MAGVCPVLLGDSIHHRADKVGVEPRPGELVPVVPLALHGQVGVHAEGQRRASGQRATQVLSEAGQQILFETGNFIKNAACSCGALCTFLIERRLVGMMLLIL